MREVEARLASSGDRSRLTRSTKSAGVSPPRRRVHCTSQKFSGTCSSSSGVVSITTGNRNARLDVIKCDRSTASFHSRRKYPLVTLVGIY
jgi:hypothetical protein